MRISAAEEKVLRTEERKEVLMEFQVVVGSRLVSGFYRFYV